MGKRSIRQSRRHKEAQRLAYLDTPPPDLDALALDLDREQAQGPAPAAAAEQTTAPAQSSAGEA